MAEYLEIKELNENSNIRFTIGDNDLNNVKECGETVQMVRNYMSVDFYFPQIKNYALLVKFYGFPSNEDPKCLASYATKRTTDKIFDIGVGSNLLDAEQKLLSFGYQKINDCFEKGLIKINLQANDGQVNSIEIALKSQYKGNRRY